MNVSSITLYEDQVEWLHMNGSDGRKVIINALKYYQAHKEECRAYVERSLAKYSLRGKPSTSSKEIRIALDVYKEHIIEKNKKLSRVIELLDQEIESMFSSICCNKYIIE